MDKGVELVGGGSAINGGLHLLVSTIHTQFPVARLWKRRNVPLFIARFVLKFYFFYYCSFYKISLICETSTKKLLWLSIQVCSCVLTPTHCSWVSANRIPSNSSSVSHKAHISVEQIFGYLNIFKYIRTNIFIGINVPWFFLKQIYFDINLWSIYTDKYIHLFLCPISMIANIFEFSVFPRNCEKWLFLVKNGSIWVQNNTNYKNG